MRRLDFGKYLVNQLAVLLVPAFDFELINEAVGNPVAVPVNLWLKHVL